MPERTFSVSYDSVAKGVSALVCVALMAIAWMVHIAFIAMLFPLFIFLAYAYSPRGYEVSGGAIVIKRLIGNIRLPLADVREVRAGAPGDFTGVIRMWGNGGLFGYYGLFRTAKLGKCSWYVTDRSKTVIVVAANKTVVLSPDNVVGFIAATGAPAGNGASNPTPPSGNSRSFIGALLGIGIGVVAITFVAMAMLYAPGPAAYTLAGDALTIHDKFYPVTLRENAVDAGQIRIVDLTQEPGWRTTARTNGFANQHYQSGWFRVANGRTVRWYRAGGSRMVLIPPKGDGNAVLYQAKDPEAFVQELQRTWTAR